MPVVRGAEILDEQAASENEKITSPYIYRLGGNSLSFRGFHGKMVV